MVISAIIAVFVFLVILFLAGFWVKKYVASSSDYLLAGREMSFGINFMGVVASGFAGTTISLAPGWGILYGFWGTFTFALCYGICGVCCYGLLFARVIRRSGAYTLPEWLEMRYDYRVRRVLTITGFIGIVAVTANNVLALANVLSGYFGISLYISIAIGVITFLGFTYFSGMWGVSLTDFLQALIGCVGAPLLLIACVSKFGGLDVTVRAWNGTFVDYFVGGIGGAKMKAFSFSYPSFFTVLLNFGVFLVWGGQHYWIRMASARSEKQARNGYGIAGFFLFLITMLIGMIGLYAGANFGNNFTIKGGTIPPTSAYGYVISFFPTAIGVFLLVFALAASLSTAASTLIAAVSIATKDIYPHFIRKNPSERQLVKAGKIATVLISIATWGLAYYPGGTTFLFAFATAWMAPAGLLFAMGLWWRRCTPTGAFVGAIFALIFESIWALLDMFKVPIGAGTIGTYVHMGIVGLVFAVIPTVIVSLKTQPKYFGAKGWKLSEGTSAIPSVGIKINDEDKLVLRYIQEGHEVMSELFDMTSWAGEKLTKVIEKLDENRYIERLSLSGLNFWSFNLTSLGAAQLPELSEKDKHLQEFGLCQRDLVMLESAKKSGKQRATELVMQLATDESERKEYAGSVVKLIRKHYLTESGFLKRFVDISEEGKQLLLENVK